MNDTQIFNNERNTSCEKGSLLLAPTGLLSDVDRSLIPETERRCDDEPA
jgi:hypothetical protein